MHSYFSEFVTATGSLFVLIAIISAWLFRSSTAHIAWKVLLPTALVVVSCWLPFSVVSILGYPLISNVSALPFSGQLIAFVPHDAQGTADMWLLSGQLPRAYEIRLDGETKSLLKEAQAELAQGKPVFLQKKRKKHEDGKAKSGGDATPLTDLKDDYEPAYEIDKSAASQLPAKE